MTPPPLPSAPPPPPDPNAPRAVEFATLRILRDKNVITEDEYQTALHDLGEPMGVRASDANTFVFGRFATTIYGFAEADVMYHSTQSYNDFAGNGLVAKPGSYAGDHTRTTFTARDSRFGLRLKAPSPKGYSFTANLEGDFLGSEPGIFQSTGGTAPAAGSTNSEAGFFQNPVFRIRHAYFKAETPILDFTVGQTWNLLGWQATYVPAIVQWPGVLGELYGRSVQVRVSKTIKLNPVTVEVAVAALRGAQRDSAIPNGEAGLRMSVDAWSAPHTSFIASTNIMPASIAVTGDVRAFRLPAFNTGSAKSGDVNTTTGGAIAIDAFLPIIPGTKTNKDNSLSVTGEFVAGEGIGDQYTGFATGLSALTLPKAAATDATNPAFNPTVDANLVGYDSGGALRLIRTNTFYLAGEYYVPFVDGRLALFGGYYSTEIVNVGAFATSAAQLAAARKLANMWNMGLFVDATSNIRIGADLAFVRDQAADGNHASHWSAQTSGFFFF